MRHPAKKLLATTIRNIKAPIEGRDEHPDTVCKGLVLRISHTGARAWSLEYRFDSLPRRYTLRADPGDVSAARREGDEAHEKIRAGIDPGVEKRNDRAAARSEAESRRAAKLRRKLSPTPEFAEGTVNAIAAEYLAEMDRRKRPKTAYEARRCLNQHILPSFGSRPMASVKGADIAPVIRKVRARGCDVAANRLIGRINALWNWANRPEVRLLEGVPSPCQGWQQTDEQERERVLSDEELILFWRATEAMGEPYKSPLRMMLLTGQRRSEVAEMVWSEVSADQTVWTLPAERAKNGRANRIPLSDLARECLPACDGVYVFKSRADNRGAEDAPLKCWTWGQAKLIEAMNKLRRESDPAAGDLEHFTLHDLRRTLATNFQRLAVPQEHTEKLLNHRDGKISGVAAIYGRHDFADEVKSAVQKWADRIRFLIDPASSNVTPLRVA
jgi:integrase